MRIYLRERVFSTIPEAFESHSDATGFETLDFSHEIDFFSTGAWSSHLAEIITVKTGSDKFVHY